MASCFYTTRDAYAEPFFAPVVTDEDRARYAADMDANDAEAREIEETLHALYMEVA